jgi:hypothetical protein
MDQKPPKMSLSHNTQNLSLHRATYDTFDSSGIKPNMTERFDFTGRDLALNQEGDYIEEE